MKERTGYRISERTSHREVTTYITDEQTDTNSRISVRETHGCVNYFVRGRMRTDLVQGETEREGVRENV